MSNLATIEARAPEGHPSRIQVIDPVPVLDTGRFEQMQRIASVMAECTMVPDHLRGYWDGTGTNKKFYEFPGKTTAANCFLVVNQSVRWGMDPFAVAQCVSIVHGRICYEGKLIAAVLDAKLGLNLVPEYNDRGGNDFGVTIYAYDQQGKPVVNPRTAEPLIIEGTVGQWRTSHPSSPWTEAKNHRRQLMYRGSREWARIHRPAIMLGVYADDEIDELSSSAHTSRARDVTPARRAPAPSDMAAIEHKPAIDAGPIIAREAEPVTPARRAPAPQELALQETEQAPEIAWTDILADYKDAAEAAQDTDALDAAFSTFISPRENDMPKQIYEMACAIDDQVRGRLE